MNKEIKEILKITNQFLKIPSVTSNEKPFLDYLNKKISKLKKYNIIQTDSYLLIKTKNNPNKTNKNKNKENKYLFSIHIDRHGFAKNNNNEIEYQAYKRKKEEKLKFNRDTKEFFENCALRHTKENISSYNPKTGKIINKYISNRNNLDWKNKLVTFTLNKDPKSNENIFMLNSQISITNNLFFAQIDNVISAAVIFYLLKTSNFQDEIIFTTQEEIGLSYKCVLDYLDKNTTENTIKNQIITLDTTPYENFNNKEKGFIVLRKGDENGDFNLNLVKEFEKIANKNKIPIEYKASNNGMTELGRISSTSKGKYNGATIQIPTTNYHTTYETSTFENLENYLKIIKKIIN
ncbi:MAG: hypothetical protein KC589_02905 [Nanoarchaeota archaeon]|nr:hypothetical protein [Nanoarchaeota archaeon]